MRNLLVINGEVFPVPEGSFSVKYNDIVNEYISESGEKTVEIIRLGMAAIAISYNALTETKKDALVNALAVVNSVTFYKKGQEVTVQMQLTGLSEPKKYFRNGLSVWGLSFSLEEL